MATQNINGTRRSQDVWKVESRCNRHGAGNGSANTVVSVPVFLSSVILFSRDSIFPSLGSGYANKIREKSRVSLLPLDCGGYGEEKDDTVDYY